MNTTTDSLTRSDLLDGFEGNIEPVRVSILYRLGMVAVTLAVVMLPLIYVGLIGVVGLGIYYHAVHNLSIFEGTGGAKGKAFIYVAPLVVGVTVILFMVKPLFAGRAQQSEPHRLDPESEPLLFAFVERLCQAVHASAPRQINVDCEVNASASFRRGWLSFFGSDLVLTIGLPLVAGLSLRQFAGVLAHEFGHFSQGAGMRLSYVIRTVNHWFSRVVYERDAWDVKLAQWSKGIDIRLGVILYLARFLVWLTRKLLHGLMLVGHAISCFMMRQMEFDADSHEARLAGSDTFEATALSLQLLGIATQQSYTDLQESWLEKRLVDDLPALIRARFDRIPGAATDSVRESLEKRKTGAFDTHPADGDRIRNAAREATEGVFREEAPASVLFRDFGDLCRRITRAQYRVMIGPQAEEAAFEASANFVQGRARHREAMAALGDYLQGAAVWQRLVFWPASVDEVNDATTLVSELESTRLKMSTASEEAARNAQAWCDADARGLNAARAAALLEAGFRIEPKDFGISHSSADDAISNWQSAGASAARLNDELRPFSEVASRRLALALAAARRPEVVDVPDRRIALDSIDAMTSALHALRSTVGDVNDLRYRLEAVGVLFQNLDGHESDASVIGAIQAKLVELTELHGKVRERLQGVAYPFGGSGDGSTLAGHIAGEIGDVTNANDICNAAQGIVDRTQALYFKILGSLVTTAVAVESSLGLPPLKHVSSEPPAE